MDAESTKLGRHKKLFNRHQRHRVRDRRRVADRSGAAVGALSIAVPAPRFAKEIAPWAAELWRTADRARLNIDLHLGLVHPGELLGRGGRTPRSCWSTPAVTRLEHRP